MAFAFVNENHNPSIGTSPAFPTTAIPSVSLNVTKGNLLIAWTTCGDNNAKMQCSDGVHVWNPIVINQAAAYGGMYCWFAIAAITGTINVQVFQTTSMFGPPAGVISGTAPAVLDYPVSQVLQFSGEYGNPVETHQFASGNSNAPSVSITATGTADLILAFAMMGSFNLATTAGWTDAAGVGNFNSAIYAIETGTGTFSPLYSAGGSSNWGCLAIAFKAASANTTHTISGSLGSGGAHASVLFLSQSTMTLYTATADNSGNYTSPALADDTYTVTPQVVGTTYTPASQVVSGSNVTLNFTGTTVPAYLAFTQTISDSFSRANENPLSDGGNWAANGTPVPPNDAPAKILSDQCVMSDATIYANYAGPWSGDCNAFWVGAALPDNQWAELQIAALNSSPSHYASVQIGLRTTPGVDYSCVIRNNGDGTCNVITYSVPVNGQSFVPVYAPTYGFFPFGTLTFQNVPFSLGDTFRVAALGTTIYVLHNGQILGNYTDSAIASGSPSFVLAGTAISDTAVTNFKGGSVAQGSAPSAGGGLNGNIVPTTIQATRVDSPRTSFVGTNLGTRIIG